MRKEKDSHKTLARILTAYKGCVEILCRSADEEAKRGIHPSYLAPFRGKIGKGKE